MITDILIEANGPETRLALLEDDELVEYYIERPGSEKLTGNIYKGRVANILPGMQAAFVNIGMEKNAFLYAGDIQVDRKDFGDNLNALENQLKELSINKMLKLGQELIVQVTKEPGGEKGPRITNHVTLPGRLAVLLPTVGYVGISHRIEDEDERTRLREMAERIKPEGMGLIVRTAAVGAAEEDLARDIRELERLWQAILRRAETAVAPAALHLDASLVYRSVRDMLSEDTRAVWIDDEAQCAAAKETAVLISPELADRIRFYDKPQPLFDLYQVEKHAEKALSRKVWLKSGGYLVVDYTEALTVIDVNTGKFVGSRSLSDTVFRINCEAAAEIARQLRLRDIGGIIVIDFIDMDQSAQREQLLTLLKNELKRDRTKTNVVGITGLGLIEMTRKKMRQPIFAQMMRPCPRCSGSGMVKSEESLAFAALRALKRTLAREHSDLWLIRLHPSVAEALSRVGCGVDARVYAVSDGSLASDEFEIKPVFERELPAKAKRLSQRGTSD